MDMCLLCVLLFALCVHVLDTIMRDTFLLRQTHPKTIHKHDRHPRRPSASSGGDRSSGRDKRSVTHPAREGIFTHSPVP
jgi:hypothetical protein